MSPRPARRLAPLDRATAWPGHLCTDLVRHERKGYAEGVVGAEDFQRRDPECADGVRVGGRVHVQGNLSGDKERAIGAHAAVVSYKVVENSKARLGGQHVREGRKGAGRVMPGTAFLGSRSGSEGR